MEVTQILDFSNCRWHSEKGSMIYNIIKDELLQYQAMYKCPPRNVELIVGLYTYEYLQSYYLASYGKSLDPMEIFGVSFPVLVNWKYDLNAMFLLLHK